MWASTLDFGGVHADHADTSRSASGLTFGLGLYLHHTLFMLATKVLVDIGKT